ncbi:MAG: histidine kinase dimerization/phospho-acceptor domain-containing protein [Candidatus Helarchaeota archaeon]
MKKFIYNSLLDEIFPLIVDNIDNLIIIMNNEFEIKYVNFKALVKKLGYNDEVILKNRNFFDFIHPSDAEILLNKLKNESINEITGNIRLLRDNGSFIKVEFRLFRIKDRNSNHKLLFIGRDISYLENIKEIEKQLKNIIESFNNKIIEFQNINPELLSDVPHHLRTPLTLIRGFTELLLKDGSLEDDIKDALKIIYKNELRLEDYINKITNNTPETANYMEN